MSEALLRPGLGAFLRARREQLSPGTVGLASGRRRRTPGLRREEVAELAGIGVDWYIRLEQGRAGRPSAATIDALARALRLTSIERAHLRALAALPQDRPRFDQKAAPSYLRTLVQTLPTPAYITGERWDLLAWNEAAADLFTDFARVSAGDRNVLVFMLCDPAARRAFGRGWRDEAARVVAAFRSSFDAWSGDPAFLELEARLTRESDEFSRWWRRHDIRAGGVGRKRLVDRHGKPADYNYATLVPQADPNLRIAIYTRLD